MAAGMRWFFSQKLPCCCGLIRVIHSFDLHFDYFSLLFVDVYRHVPKAKATTVVETPEMRRLAENTKLQSQVRENVCANNDHRQATDYRH
jgi:hypothetical protein